MPNLPEKFVIAITTITEKLLGSIFPPQIGSTNSSYVGELLLSQMSKKAVPIHSQIFSPQFFSSITILTVISIIGVYYFRKRSLFGFSIIWMYVSLLPVLFISFQSSDGSMTQLIWDRYLFIQTYGISLILSWIGFTSYTGLQKSHSFVLFLA